MNASNIVMVYQSHPHESGDVHYVLVAKFLQVPGRTTLLEDHTPDHTFDAIANDPVAMESKLNAAKHSMYFQVCTLQELNEGEYPELLSEALLPPAHGPESRFDYFRIGMPQPQLLEFYEGEGHLDGHPLSDEELRLIHSNIEQGLASLSYHKEEPEVIAKSEDLAKVEPHLEAALGGLRAAVAAGHVHPDVLKTLSGHIFKDTMVPTMGNKVAMADFLSRPKDGIHIRLDGSRFGGINKRAGFETGNEAIKSMFGAVRSALDESVGRKNAKSFRIGGDEAHVFVPTVEHAAMFHRSLKRHLDALPLVAGQKLAFDMGVGKTPETAEQGLIKAKTHGKSMNYPLHELRTHCYVNVPGHEGHLPTETEQPPKMPSPTATLTPTQTTPVAPHTQP